MVAFRKYQCHNVGTLLPTLGSIGLGLGEVGEVGEVVTGPERSGHGQPPHWAPAGKCPGQDCGARGGILVQDQIIIWCSHCPVSTVSRIYISWAMIERGCDNNWCIVI